MQKVVLSEVVDYLHKAYPDASIGVGGSVAAGTYRADSDVDVLFQREDCRKSFLVSFFCKGVKVSIFSFSKDMLLRKERKYLLNYNNMPISFISDVHSIHDEKDLITDLKYFVKDIVERRRILKYVLIDELKTSIANLLQVKPSSLIDAKRKTYAVIDKMICIFYLKFHADRIVQKQEGRNPYWIIERDDDTLYKSLKECMPYNIETYERVNEIFKKYLRFY